jgi:hypothetical protein
MDMMKKKTIKLILIVIAMALVLQVSYFTFAEKGQYSDNTDINKPENSIQRIYNKTPKDETKALGISDVAEINLIKKPQKLIDTSKITLPKEIEDNIKKSDNKNYSKNINNYKKLMSELNVPIEFRNEIDELILKEYKLSDILIAYDFLYDIYGEIKELLWILEKRAKGESFEDIFTDYSKLHLEFAPSDFDNSYLEKLMKTNSIDDIMIADRISQKGLMKFEDLIALKNSGKSWSTIKKGLNIINMDEVIPRMSLTSGQVKKCMKDTGLKEKQAIDVLILTWKTGKNYSEILDKVKKGKKIQGIYSEIYDEKYK